MEIKTAPSKKWWIVEVCLWKMSIFAVVMEVKDRYRRFGEWKQQPHQVAPLAEDEHECATCGTHYVGNYCPRCGQSAKIGRYSFKNALLLYFDVWGLGNRGMFRSIRDLLLRPGYMIRDYLRGMQMAYFPPFKMFFLLIALSLLVDSGMNIQGINREEQNKAEEEELLTNWIGAKKDQTKPQTKSDKVTSSVTERMDVWIDQHISAFYLICLLLFSVPLFLLFRHSPAIPDLRLSECFVAMVYITNMLIIYNIVPSLLCFSVKAEMIYSTLAMLLFLIPIKQLTGYSYPSTIWRVVVALVPFLVLILLLYVAVGIAIASYEHFVLHTLN